MAKDIWKDRKKLNFREAEGLISLPTQLLPKQISKKMRVRLWELFDSTWASSAIWGDLDHAWSEILYDHHVQILEFFSDDFSNRLDIMRRRLRPLFENGGYGDVLEFVQFTLRHPDCPKDLDRKVATILEETRSAYRLIKSPPTIVPFSSEESVAAVEAALESTKGDQFSAAHEHLIEAAAHLSKGHDADAIRESIHAVESVAKLIDGNSKATLGPALKRIEEKSGAIHPALRKAFEALYGYTSDKDGIRHASLKPGDKNVGEDEAIFMYVACAGFVSYLIGKSAKMPTASN